MKEIMVVTTLLMAPLMHPTTLAGSLSDEAIAWYNSGNDSFVIGHYDQAVKYYLNSLSFDGGFLSAWTNLGAAYQQLGRYQDALDALDTALSIDPGDSLAWNNKGLVQTDLEQYEEALFCFEMALKVNSLQKESWVNMGVCLINLDRLDEAGKALKTALELDPGYDLAMFNSAILSGRLSDQEAMLEWLGKAIQENPRYAKEAREARYFSPWWDDPKFIELLNQTKD